MPSAIEELNHRTALGSWCLSRADPDSDLAEVVREYWEVKGRLNPFREALLPNGYVELMVNLGPPHRVFDGTGMGVWDNSWFSGVHERSIFIESLDGTHLVSVRMHPLGATALFGYAAPNAANSIIDLETLVGPDAEDLRAKLLRADGPGDRFGILETFLRERLSPGFAIPDFVRAATARLEQTHGSIPIRELHEEGKVSRKHLSVSFNRYVGVSAKAYARIQRFVWTLEQLRNSGNVEWSRIAAEAGYSDQSHLVRDFRRIGAASPTEYLQRFAPDRDALLEATR